MGSGLGKMLVGAEPGRWDQEMAALPQLAFPSEPNHLPRLLQAPQIPPWRPSAPDLPPWGRPEPQPSAVRLEKSHPAIPSHPSHNPSPKVPPGPWLAGRDVGIMGKGKVESLEEHKGMEGLAQLGTGLEHLHGGGESRAMDHLDLATLVCGHCPTVPEPSWLPQEGCSWRGPQGWGEMGGHPLTTTSHRLPAVWGCGRGGETIHTPLWGAPWEVQGQEQGLRLKARLGLAPCRDYQDWGLLNVLSLLKV